MTLFSSLKFLFDLFLLHAKYLVRFEKLKKKTCSDKQTSSSVIHQFKTVCGTSCYHLFLNKIIRSQKQTETNNVFSILI